MRYRFAEILPYRVHPSSTDAVNLIIRKEKAIHLITGDSSYTGTVTIKVLGGNIKRPSFDKSDEWRERMIVDPLRHDFGNHSGEVTWRLNEGKISGKVILS